MYPKHLFLENHIKLGAIQVTLFLWKFDTLTGHYGCLMMMMMINDVLLSVSLSLKCLN